MLNAVVLPYELVRPYSTCESDDSFVTHVTVAPEEVMPDVATEEITGGVVSAVVVVGAGVVVVMLPPRAYSSPTSDADRALLYIRTSSRMPFQKLLGDDPPLAAIRNAWLVETFVIGLSVPLEDVPSCHTDMAVPFLAAHTWWKFPSAVGTATYV